MRLMAVHLLNDFSGSPKVLRQVLEAVRESREVVLFTAGGREGFLSQIPEVENQTYWYRWSANAWQRLLNYSLSQLLLFFRVLFFLKKGDLVYINTVLPFGAAFAAFLRRKPIVWHLHETHISPAPLSWFLFGLARRLATETILVSQYMEQQLEAYSKPVHVVPNALPDAFFMRARLNRKLNPSALGNVLMLCSLKWYKGVEEFLALARRMPSRSFRLVLNAPQEECEAYFKTLSPIPNLEWFPVQTDTHPHYAWADLVLNLSRPDGWVETFGLTAIEALAYGLPVIVPPIGGIAEVVENGIQGFHIDCRQTQSLDEAVQFCLQPEAWNRFHYESLRRAERFSAQAFSKAVLSVLEGLR